MAIHVSESTYSRLLWVALTFWAIRVTCGFVEAGGVVPEKFNAVEASANIDAEYGNQVSSFCSIKMRFD